MLCKEYHLILLLLMSEYSLCFLLLLQKSQFLTTNDGRRVPVVQGGSSLHIVHLPHREYNGVIADVEQYVGDVTRVDRIGYKPGVTLGGPSWLGGDWAYVDGVFGMWLAANDGYESRSTIIYVYGTKGTCTLQLVQHSYLDIVEFECPVMKQVAVELWDKNGDGEISYYETDDAVLTDKKFSRRDYTSFRELKNFCNVVDVPPYMFADSDIKNFLENDDVNKIKVDFSP